MSNQKDMCNIVVDGKLYDCNSWKEYHPGGKEVMDKYHNQDATDVFHAFHGPEGFEKLQRMKSTEVPSEVDPLTADFRALRKKLVEEGWFESSLLWYTYKTVETLGLAVLGLTVGCYFGHWVIGALILGLAYQQLGWLAHDYCHQQVFKNRRLNNFFGYFCGNVMSGYSVNWWKERHNTHHAITNVLDADPDVDNLPLFIWDKHDFARVPTMPVSAKLIPYQSYYFLPFTLTLKIIWNLQSIFFVRRKQSAAWERVASAERRSLIIHYLALFLICFFSFNSIGAAIGFVLISELVGGAGIANIVFMNHYGCDQLNIVDGKKTNFVQLQLMTTRNIDPSLWMNWFSGGLNLQIEHHLFPTMPRHNLLKVRPLVQELCKKHNLAYQSKPFFGCLSAILKKLAFVAEEFKEHEKSLLVGDRPSSPSIKLKKGNENAW